VGWGKGKLARHTNQKLGKISKRWISTCVTLEGLNNYTLTWTSRRGFFTNTTCIKLNCIGQRRTMLTHTQTVHGPMFSFGFSPKVHLTNSSCINQCFKNHVESLHFRNLFVDLSSRGMKSTATMPCSDEEWSGSSSTETFWQTSARFRQEVMSLLIEEVGPDHYCVALKE
jgi:hypothetical protein